MSLSGVKSLSEDSLKTFSKSQANIRDIPWYVWFVVFNELCERFAYYGISGILFQYLNEQLGYSDSASTSITLVCSVRFPNISVFISSV